MNRPPLPVIVIAILFLLTGIASLAGDAFNFKAVATSHYVVWIAGVHLLAIVAGVFLLLRRNWARWLAIAWMVFHVAISLCHPLQQLLVHAAFLLLFAWFLFFSAEVRAWFGGSQAAA